MKSRIVIIILLLVFVKNLQAGGAHVHGHARMTIVLDGETLQVTIIFAAHDLLGFEHAPNTPEEQQLIDAAVAELENNQSWLVLSGGACNTQSVQIVNPFHHLGHEHHGANEHDHNHASQTFHYDFELAIKYECEKPAELDSLTVKIHQKYDAIRELEVQWLVDDKQGLTHVTPDQATVKFK